MSKQSNTFRLLVVMGAIIIFAMFMNALLTGCTTTQTTDTGVRIDTKVDPHLYHVVVQLEDQDSYTEQNMSFYLYDTYAKGIVWSDGKGLLRGTLLSVDPPIEWAKPEHTIVVKTTDRKITALLPGDIAELTCVADFEPVCGWNETANVAGNCEDIWEFDYCRLRGFEDEEGVKPIPSW